IVIFICDLDFGIMFTHHIVAVILITCSYITNLTRVGTLILCLHDVSDIVLEAAKMANYCKCQKLSDLLFLTFAVVFIVTRLGIYPFWILNTTLFELYEALGNFPAFWILNVLLMVHQTLNCIWSYLIIKTAYKAISKGKVRLNSSSYVFAFHYSQSNSIELQFSVVLPLVYKTGRCHSQKCPLHYNCCADAVLTC
uniref:Ceramide synthase 6 n=1 Tax=Malurus cyaneus samueli TaxID=2593467 RepID=A0A8C5UNI5_9PASS